MAREGDRIGRRLIACAVAAIVSVSVVAICGIVLCFDDSSPAQLREQILHLNEVRTELAIGPGDTSDGIVAADSALARTQGILRDVASEHDTRLFAAILILAAIAIVAILAIVLYLHISIVRPFARLEDFAGQVANGNLDAPLTYERSNPFGRFTWAFDHLRTELKRSCAVEQASSEAYKTALASLSHDLRTPLASLRTYAEALELGLDRSPEERRSYERIIMAKCDEAAELVEDLLVHALADMDRIEVACEPTSIAPLLNRSVVGFVEPARISCMQADEATVDIDPKRIGQAIDNLLANAGKYARESEVEVSGVCDGDSYRIVVRDFGPGVAPEDLPFLTNRFYRGSNAQGEVGAGLGLFIVNHLVTCMNGTMRIQNANPGLLVAMEFPLSASPCSSSASSSASSSPSPHFPALPSPGFDPLS